MSSLFDHRSPLELARLERDLRLLRATRNQAFAATEASPEGPDTAPRKPDVAAHRLLGRLTHLSRAAHRP